MGDVTMLAAAAEALGSDLTGNQLDLFATYQNELLDWNRRINLTAVVDPSRLQVELLADCLSCLRVIPKDSSFVRIIDVGTGAGIPGLPLKIARPEIELVLLDSVRKKTAFLQHVIARLGLSGVEVITRRAEDLGQDADHRERYDVVVSRAVAALPTLAELCLPFARIGGRFIAPKKAGIEPELQRADRAIAILGGRLLALESYDLPFSDDRRILVVVEKAGSTPAKYPRRPGVPSKRPL